MVDGTKLQNKNIPKMSSQDLSRSLWRYRRFTAFFCLFGFCLSYYAVHVEVSKLKDSKYQALCDISETISCSAVFTSEYGTGFGIIGKLLGEDSVINQPNGVYGMIMYPFFLICSLISIPFVAFIELILGISGLFVSGYLGYVLFYILEDVCVVCITTYVTNFFLFICALYNYRAVKKSYNSESNMNGKTKKRV